MKKDNAIEIKNLGKRYWVGERERYLTLRDALTGLAKIPFRVLGNHQTPGHHQIWALQNVNLEIKKGEILGVIGKNGAGKTTLLKILSRITQPTTGEIKIRGRVSSLLEVGTGFHPELTGRENIFLNGSILGMTRKEIENKFQDIVEFAGIEQFIDTPVKRYSSGMKVRLAFSVAAHLEPEILLVDEVLAVGDIEFQKKCLGKMEEVTGTTRTVIFVSHNMGQVRRLCGRVILIEKGKVTAEGNPDKVIDQYLSSAAPQMGLVKTGKLLQDPEETIVLLKVEVYGEERGTQPQTGKTCHVGLTFRFKNKLKNPAPIISIRTLGGTELLKYATSPISGVYTGEQVGKVNFNLKIDELPLSGGTYVLAIGISVPLKNIIPVSEVARFDIRSSDYYQSGHLTESTRGYVVAKHSWSWG